MVLQRPPRLRQSSVTQSATRCRLTPAGTAACRADAGTPPERSGRGAHPQREWRRRQVNQFQVGAGRAHLAIQRPPAARPPPFLAAPTTARPAAPRQNTARRPAAARARSRQIPLRAPRSTAVQPPIRRSGERAAGEAVRSGERAGLGARAVGGMRLLGGSGVGRQRTRGRCRERVMRGAAGTCDDAVGGGVSSGESEWGPVEGEENGYKSAPAGPGGDALVATTPRSAQAAHAHRILCYGICQGVSWQHLHPYRGSPTESWPPPVRAAATDSPNTNLSLHLVSLGPRDIFHLSRFPPTCNRPAPSLSLSLSLCLSLSPPLPRSPSR